jgi:hypothetical protein
MGKTIRAATFIWFRSSLSSTLSSPYLSISILSSWILSRSSHRAQSKLTKPWLKQNARCYLLLLMPSLVVAFLFFSFFLHFFLNTKWLFIGGNGLFWNCWPQGEEKESRILGRILHAVKKHTANKLECVMRLCLYYPKVTRSHSQKRRTLQRMKLREIINQFKIKKTKQNKTKTNK